MQRLLILIGVGVVLVGAASRRQPAAGQATGGAPEITPALREATLRFAPEVTPQDRAWILAALARARPEAQRLIAEVDGLVEVRTDLDREHAIGLTHVEGDSVSVSVDVRALNGDRALDRDVVVLHELGHVIDYVLVPDDLRARLDTSIPKVGTCDPAAEAPTGACTAIEERFADTFAKWALRGRFSLAGSGYGIPAPASLEGWGAPLGRLAAQLSAN
jgi:hypothetical protein